MFRQRKRSSAIDSKKEPLLGMVVPGAADDAADDKPAEDLVEQRTTDIGQYSIGGRVHNLGQDNINGIVRKITGDYPGATAGGGMIVIAKDAPGMTPAAPAPAPRRSNACSTSVITLNKPKTMELATSNIAQYSVGGHVANLGPAGSTHGTIRSIVPDEPGATDGPGRIFITPKAPPEPAERSSARSVHSEGTAAEASAVLRSSGPMVLVNRKICVLDVTGGRVGTVIALKKTLGKSTQHVVRFDVGGPEETLLLQKSDGSKGVKFTLFT